MVFATGEGNPSRRLAVAASTCRTAGARARAVSIYGHRGCPSVFRLRPNTPLGLHRRAKLHTNDQGVSMLRRVVVASPLRDTSKPFGARVRPRYVQKRGLDES